MRARHASFLISASAASGFPPEDRPEVAVTGRSNVGKSSLLNTLVGSHGLARTSSTPGRTQLLNWFAIDPPKGPPLYLVDFPGYGYAKVPRGMRHAFGPLINGYLETRAALKLVIVIIDIRRGPEEDESLFVEWLAEKQRPTLVVLTKTDKLPKSKRIPAASAVKRALGLARPPLLFSATEAEGIDDLWRAIAKTL